MQVTKRCPKCEAVKDVEEFSGGNSYCRPCWNGYARDYRAANPERTKRAKARYLAANPPTPEQNRTRSLWSCFRLTDAQWEDMFVRQDRRCAICRTDTPTGHNWHVDHDHACCPQVGRSCGVCVRAILCSECNTGLGKFRDDPAVLRAAADYLERVKE